MMIVQENFPDKFEFEDEDDSDDGQPNTDEEQVAVTSEFLSGKISFQDSIT
jgi:hypothetical protein